jgi:ATP-dependent helicase/nuclease subunit B
MTARPARQRDRPAVYTIPPGIPFVDALAARLMAEAGDDPLSLARQTVLLPTRRGCRALHEAFLRRGPGRPLLLPRLRPLGDLDPDELMAGGEDVAEGAAAAELPPAMPSLRRQLRLAHEIMATGTSPDGSAPTAEQAARLAAELARLLDQVQTERLSLDGLDALVPEDYARHWQRTLDFLALLRERWPALLAAEDCLDPAERRNRLLAAQAEAWRRDPPRDPVIVAGSTGSIPATADLIEVVAWLPTGRVVLPGLDREADEEQWRAILDDAAHPQHGLALLLTRLDLDRAAVADWLEAAHGLTATPPSRARLVAEALRPAVTTESWREIRRSIEPERWRLALRGVQRIDCPGPQEEAGLIALMLRQALEAPEKRAALVTPDRDLARRVAGELRRWSIDIDDSAGRPLADTAPGSYLRLIADLAAERAAPVPFLAALKHPLAAAGKEPGAFRALVRKLEIALLRGPRPAPGLDGLRRAAEHLRDADERRSLTALLARLDELAAPFTRLIEAPRAEIAALVDAHVALAEALSATADQAGAARLWAGDAGEAAAAFVAELRQAARAFAPLPGRQYPALIGSLMAGLVVRPRHGGHPRLAIWGPLEARLQHADLLILGGLNEGTWPPEPPVDPWLSRPMRRAFGLPPPERRIGLAAHDFAQAMGAAEVVLTRSLRVEGTPTVPSRWLQRLDGLLESVGLAAGDQGALDRPTLPLGWQAMLDHPASVRPVGPPAPRPPVSARPRRLSVTQVETWMRDPYAIYARHILKLKALDPIDADPGAAERGSFIHDALHRFVRDHPGALPVDAYDKLLDCGREAFRKVLDRPAVWAFWWPRFERIAGWFVGVEAARRGEIAASFTERRGTLDLAGPRGAFQLTAKADRIDRIKDGGLVLIDYKTGQVPTDKHVALGFSPQLPLEAAIAAAGGFAEVPAAPAAALAYWRLSGGDPAGEIREIKADAATLATDARAGLERLIAAFDDPATPYAARPRPEYGPRFSDYDHLARLLEWSAGGEDS